MVSQTIPSRSLSLLTSLDFQPSFNSLLHPLHLNKDGQNILHQMADLSGQRTVNQYGRNLQN